MKNEEEDGNFTEGWRKSMRRRVTGHVIRRFGWDMDLQTVAAALRNELPRHTEVDENTLFLVEVTVTQLPYDGVVEWEGRCWRVQVKSTIYRRRGESYSLNVMGPGRKAYRRGLVDFVAVYLIPIDRWYIIPYEALGEKKCSVHFKPGGIRQKYEEYREAWDRLKMR